MTPFISETLGDQHSLDEFESDRPELDAWLKREARRAQSRGMARVTVWCHADSTVVIAYYAITPTQVAPDGLARSVRAGYSGPIPGYLIAKLALSRNLAGQGLGGQLLLDALETISDAADIAGGRLIVVDAIDQRAFDFYRYFGFTQVGNSMRLFARIDDVAASIESGSRQGD